LLRVNLNGAELGGIRHFTTSSFEQLAWWEAHRISRELLDYLLEKYPHNPQTVYGIYGGGRHVLAEVYAAALERQGKSVVEQIRSASR
jgi:hypothetical protein